MRGEAWTTHHPPMPTLSQSVRVLRQPLPSVHMHVCSTRVAASFGYSWSDTQRLRVHYTRGPLREPRHETPQGVSPAAAWRGLRPKTGTRRGGPPKATLKSKCLSLSVAFVGYGWSIDHPTRLGVCQPIHHQCGGHSSVCLPVCCAVLFCFACFGLSSSVERTRDRLQSGREGSNRMNRDPPLDYIPDPNITPPHQCSCLHRRRGGRLEVPVPAPVLIRRRNLPSAILGGENRRGGG